MVDENAAIRNIGKNLKALRKKNRITMVVLSAEIGITHGHISQIESGKNDAGLKTAIRISKFFNVTIEELMEPPEEFTDKNLINKLNCFFQENDQELSEEKVKELAKLLEE